MRLFCISACHTDCSGTDFFLSGVPGIATTQVQVSICWKCVSPKIFTFSTGGPNGVRRGTGRQQSTNGNVSKWNLKSFRVALVSLSVFDVFSSWQPIECCQDFPVACSPSLSYALLFFNKLWSPSSLPAPAVGVIGLKNVTTTRKMTSLGRGKRGGLGNAQFFFNFFLTNRHHNKMLTCEVDGDRAFFYFLSCVASSDASFNVLKFHHR